jgi:hypothetical protein
MDTGAPLGNCRIEKILSRFDFLETERLPLKPLRAGMPGDSGVPVASTPVLSTFAQGAAGAAGTRHSPRPQGGEKINVNLGRVAPRDRERVSGVEMSTLVMPGQKREARLRASTVPQRL